MKKLILLSILLLSVCYGKLIRIQDYETIQAAINAASDGDRVEVTCPEIYHESINFNGKNILVIGYGNESNSSCRAILDGTHIEGRVVTFANGENSSATLKGFKIINSADGAMKISSSNPTISDCIFSDNHVRVSGGLSESTTHGSAISISNANPIIKNCTFFNNRTLGDAGAINISQSNPIISRCTFMGNSSGHVYYGIHGQGGNVMKIADSSNPIIINSTFYRNPGASSTILTGWGSYNKVMIINSILWGNNDQFHIYGNSGTIQIINSNVIGYIGGENNINSEPKMDIIMPSAGKICAPSNADVRYKYKTGHYCYSMTGIWGSAWCAQQGLDDDDAPDCEAIECCAFFLETETEDYTPYWNWPLNGGPSLFGTRYVCCNGGVYEEYGCLHGGALNYNPTATYDPLSYNEDDYYSCIYSESTTNISFEGNVIAAQLQTDSPCIDTGIDFFEFDADTIINLNANEYLGSAPDMGAFEYGAIHGCTDHNACNYNANATVDIGSCLYRDCENVCGGNLTIDCAGVCGGDLELDCAGECDGHAALDECEVCNGDNSSCNLIFDIDGNYYYTIQIGEQIWMAENLKTTHYNNGGEIPTGYSNEEWVNLSTGAYSIYNADSSNADIYGNLYNWYALNDGELLYGGICPNGFHVPSYWEWMILADYLGGIEVAGGKMKESGHQHWNFDSNSITEEATNESGFTGLPGGRRLYVSSGGYGAMRGEGQFWTSTGYNELHAGGGNKAYMKILNYNLSGLSGWDWYKSDGYSVRCIEGELKLGCKDSDACNYDQDATIDNGSCGYEFDCAGTCAGSALEDECGVCDGAGIPESDCDCDGNVLDACGICNGSGLSELLSCDFGFFGAYGFTYEEASDWALSTWHTNQKWGCTTDAYRLPNQWSFAVCCLSGDCESNPGSVVIVPANDPNIYWEEGSILNTFSAACDSQIVCDCDGNVLDECGVCGGNGIAVGACNCDDNALDSCDNCGGDCVADENNFVTCSSIEVNVNNTTISDECGLCGGDNLTCTGCMDDIACNYNDCNGDEVLDDPCTIENNQLCSYPEEVYLNCDGICINDSNGDGVCDELSLFNGLVPEYFSIHSIYPNPFNPITKITYGLPEYVNVQITVYGMGGTHIATLVNTFQTAGYHTISWNASSYPSGVYLIRMDSGDFTQTQKVVLVK